MSDCKYQNCKRPVFSRGVCRSHYDQERKAEVPTCSVGNCERVSSRKGLCDAHYRSSLAKLKAECVVPGCEGRQKAKGYCDRHYQRLVTHGHVHPTRGVDWGAREKHPLYQTYHHHKNRTKRGMAQEWANDFWKFVEDVGVRPDNHVLTAEDRTGPIGPANWIWREKAFKGTAGAAYQRHYRKTKSRNVKNTYLKSKYGISLEDYEAMVAEQGGGCAICKQGPRGKRYSSLVVDHCHDTGIVRGLLCDHCNRGLGLFGDNPETLEAAALYLRGQ